HKSGDSISKQQSLDTYTAVFGYVSIGILVTTIIMVILTPILNKYINRIRVIDDHKADIDNIT
ncbi:MFS transporter, partial [Francisella tularensis subsp. holarctica]|nr:MFS transporter [Francisella tularensis subsp. holarctica]